jgi:hypothetical protein
MDSGRGLKASPDSYGEFGYADEIQHNLQTAKAPGVVVPASLLAAVDEVIE